MNAAKEKKPVDKKATASVPDVLKQARLMQILRSPRMTEKSTRVADKHNQFVFEVTPDADKAEIKAAVELIFKVQVEDVTVLNVKGKFRRFRQQAGRTRSWKKAYIRLASGQEISFAN